VTDEATQEQLGVSQDSELRGDNTESASPEESRTEGRDEQADVRKSPMQLREEKLAALAEKRREQVEAERKAAKEINDPDSAVLEGEDDDDEPDAQKAPVRPGWQAREDGVLVKRVKVNGVEREITEEEYDALAQKELAGDQKLQQAAERERRAVQREQELRQMEQQLRERETALKSSPPDEGGLSDEEFAKVLKEYHTAIYDGDEDVAAEKFKILNQARSSSTPNLDQLTREAAIRAREEVRAELNQEKFRESVNTGWKRFREEYAEIAGNTARLAYADVHLKAVRQENPELTPEAAIMEAGRRTAEELGLAVTRKDDSAEPAPESRANDRASREERKANLKPIPRSSTKAHKPPEKPRAPSTQAEKIAQMKRARAL